MCKEKKYKWCVKTVRIKDIIESACEEECKDFMVWCFQNNIGIGEIWDVTNTSKNTFGERLMQEICKPNRNSWLDFAIEQGYVKEVEPEETFSVGDVIETMNRKYIINTCDLNEVCLNGSVGNRCVCRFTVNNIKEITYNEIYQNTKTHFKKIGHGAKNLI